MVKLSICPSSAKTPDFLSESSTALQRLSKSLTRLSGGRAAIVTASRPDKGRRLGACEATTAATAQAYALPRVDRNRRAAPFLLRPVAYKLLAVGGHGRIKVNRGALSVTGARVLPVDCLPGSRRPDGLRPERSYPLGWGLVASDLIVCSTHTVCPCCRSGGGCWVELYAAILSP